MLTKRQSKTLPDGDTQGQLESEIGINKEILFRFSSINRNCTSETFHMGGSDNPFDHWRDGISIVVDPLKNITND